MGEPGLCPGAWEGRATGAQEGQVSIYNPDSLEVGLGYLLEAGDPRQLLQKSLEEG